jgi:hypothetical protein
VDLGAVPQCEATDEEFRALGPRACPPESQVGEGTLEARTGTPADPIHGDVTAFNGVGEIIELVTVPGTDRVAGMDRLTVEGSTLTAHPPAVPGGPPDGRTAVREVHLVLPARAGTDGRPYVSTPSACPADGLWRSLGTFTFNDGGSGTASATTPCVAAAQPAPAASAAAPVRARPGLRVRLVSPRRVRAGRRTRFVVRVSSAVPTCTRHATVRIGRARGVTDARGRATLVTRVRRRFRVRVTRPGCAGVRRAVSVHRR